MRARTVLLLVAATALGGCEATPANPKREKVTVTRDLLHAFRDAVRAHYELRLLAEPGYVFKGDSDRELAAAKDAEKRGRARLVQALIDAGSREARRSEKLSDLIPILRDAIHGGDWAFIVEPDGDNFALVRLAQRPEEHQLSVGGEKWAYTVFRHDEMVIEDYPTFRAAKLAPPGSLLVRPAVTLGRNVYLDLQAASRIGREKFFPRVAAYRELAGQALASDKPFVALANDTPRLLGLAKDVLRWRSLETFWARVQNQPAEIQERRFAEDYTDREELRAAYEAYELDKLRGTGVERPSGDRLVALEMRTYLEAIIQGEPLGHVATVAGLAGDIAANPKAKLDPALEARLRAAAGVAGALIRKLAPDAGPRGDDAVADAKDVARLTRATPDELHGAAIAVRDELAAKAAKTPR